MAILAIVPGKPNMCLQENLADCVDCGGLGGGVSRTAKLFIKVKYGQWTSYRIVYIFAKLTMLQQE